MTTRLTNTTGRGYVLPMRAKDDVVQTDVRLGAGETVKVPDWYLEAILEEPGIALRVKRGDILAEPVLVPPTPEEPPGPTEGEGGEGGEGGEDDDPWGLDDKDRDELRQLVHQLGFEKKVDLRLGEERLREALRAAIDEAS
jgi:hypothetical protein